MHNLEIQQEKHTFILLAIIIHCSVLEENSRIFTQKIYLFEFSWKKIKSVTTNNSIYLIRTAQNSAVMI